MRNQSTFMVEMTEAANILHNATQRSLVVLDELGRGTSTFDGLSLAWAITEHLAKVTRCRTFVATHYHELTELAELLDGVKNYHVAVRELPSRAAGLSPRDDATNSRPEESDSLVFLHRIVEGGTSKSYGIHVARLAGIPKSVVARAREILDELQRNFARESHTPQLSGGKGKSHANQLTLFRDPGAELLDELRGLNFDHLAPSDAVERLRQWRARFG